MKFTHSIAITILVFCAFIEAAPVPKEDVPIEGTVSSAGFLDGLLAGKPKLGDLTENVSGLLGGLTGNKDHGGILSGLLGRSEEPKTDDTITASGFFSDILSGKPDLSAVPGGLPGLLGKFKGGKKHSGSHSGGFLDRILAGHPDLSGLVSDDVQGVLSDVLQGVEVPDSLPEQVRTPVHSILDSLKKKKKKSHHGKSHDDNLFGAWAVPAEQEDLDADINASSFLGNLMSGNADLTGLIPGEVRTVLGEVCESFS